MTQIKEMIQVLNESGKECKDHGILLGYHNHSWEFEEVEGSIPFEIMMAELDTTHFTFQLDTYWIWKAGRNLTEILDTYPGRFSTCHFKNIDTKGDFEDVGHGEINFKAFTRQAVPAGIKYFFVERDSPPDPLQSITRSSLYLKKMKY